MTAKSAILCVVCATALIGVAVWLAVEHGTRLRLGEENKALRQQLGQMAGLVAENERLTNVVAQADRSPSLPDDQLKELLRLRGEVGVLRKQGKEARAALESSLKPQNAGPTAGAAIADYWPRDSWAFAAYATPDAALRTSVWASSKGNLKALRGSITGDLQEAMEKLLEGKPESEVLAALMAETARIKSIHILSREVQDDDTIVLMTAFEEENRIQTG
jgi:hypothetical protein